MVDSFFNQFDKYFGIFGIFWQYFAEVCRCLVMKQGVEIKISILVDFLDITNKE